MRCSSTISESPDNCTENNSNLDVTEQHALMPVTIQSKGLLFSEINDSADLADTIEDVNEGILNPNAVVLKIEQMPLKSVADKCDKILHPEASIATNTAYTTGEAQVGFCSGNQNLDAKPIDGKIEEEEEEENIILKTK